MKGYIVPILLAAAFLAGRLIGGSPSPAPAPNCGASPELWAEAQATWTGPGSETKIEHSAKGFSARIHCNSGDSSIYAKGEGPAPQIALRGAVSEARRLGCGAPAEKKEKR